ncbi:hypothetical protein MMC10_007691 [Thelotrema lepadinum]|nr:hypothetical protein [Thelotrema lepadinum]
MLVEKLQPQIQPPVSRAHIIELYGPRGSGKTQLALNFASNFGENYGLILWIDATDNNTLIRSYERCAAAMGLSFFPDWSDTTIMRDHPSVQGVFRWLRQYQAPRAKWMLVIDGAETLRGLEDAIPLGLNGDILITSEKGFAAESILLPAEKIRVGGFTPDEAREALLRPLYPEVDLENDTTLAHIMQSTAIIVADLDYSPLAIELARGHMPQKPDEDKSLQFMENLKVSRTVLEVTTDPVAAAQINAISVIVNLSLTKMANQSDINQETLYPRLLFTFLAHFPLLNIGEGFFRLAQIGLASVVAEERLIPMEYLNQSTTLKGHVDRLFTNQLQSMTIDEQDRAINEASQKTRARMGKWPKLPSWLAALVRSDASGEQWDRTSFDVTIEPLLAYGLLKRETASADNNNNESESLPMLTMHPTLHTIFQSPHSHPSTSDQQPSATDTEHEQEYQPNNHHNQVQLFLALASRGCMLDSSNAIPSALRTHLGLHIASASWSPFADELERTRLNPSAALHSPNRVAMFTDPAKVLLHTQHWTAAEHLTSELLSMRRTLFGPWDPITLITTMDLGWIQVRQRKWEAAASTLQGAVSRWELESILEGGRLPVEAVKASLYLARSLLHLGRTDEGERRLDVVEAWLLAAAEEIIEHRAKEVLEQQASVPELLDEMAYVRFVNQFRLDDAARLEHLAVRVSEVVLGVGHMQTEKAREMHGLYVKKQDEVVRLEEERKTKEAEKEEKKKRKKKEEIEKKRERIEKKKEKIEEKKEKIEKEEEFEKKKRKLRRRKSRIKNRK